MLARTQSHQRVFRMKLNGCIYMHSVNLWIFQKLFIRAITMSRIDVESISYFIEIRFRTLADCIHIRMRVLLVNRNELSSKAQAYNCNIHFSTLRSE